ncbi:MAG: hypothetical protein P1U74_09140 [Legionellaceae bacterium]|nr:hypothetical protein [Legionellaceae bacterium]
MKKSIILPLVIMGVTCLGVSTATIAANGEHKGDVKDLTLNSVNFTANHEHDEDCKRFNLNSANVVANHEHDKF